MQPKTTKLLDTLSTIIQRYNALLFRKLIILTTEPQENEQKIRNYDLQCEGAQYIIAILGTKITAIKLKYFHDLKQYAENKREEQNLSSISRIRYKNNGIFSRSAKNGSQSNFKNVWQQHNTGKNVGKSQRSINPELDEIDSSFQQVMQKLSNLNYRIKHKNNVSRQEQRKYREGVKKRKRILEKLQGIEYQLDQEMNQQNNNTKSNLSMKHEDRCCGENGEKAKNLSSRITYITEEANYIINVQMTP